MTFSAEKVDSADQKFATFKVDASSVHYPIGYIVWGNDSGTQNIASSASPFPVHLQSGQDTVVTVTGYTAPSTTVTVTGYTAPSTTVTVTGYVAPSTTITAAIAAGSNSSSNPVYTISSAAAGGGSSTVTITAASNDSSSPMFVHNSSSNPAFVRGVGDSTVPVSGTVAISGGVSVEPTSSATIGLHGFSSAGNVVSQTFELGDSLAQTVMTSSGRMVGYSMSNPDTAANVWVKMFSDDSAGVTLGTTAPKRNVMVPFGGGREFSTPIGIDMSSGMAIVATAAAGDTAAVTAPSTTIYVTIDFIPSS